MLVCIFQHHGAYGLLYPLFICGIYEQKLVATPKKDREVGVSTILPIKNGGSFHGKLLVMAMLVITRW